VPYNTGWHLAHHVDSGIPFRKLPALHEEVAPRYSIALFDGEEKIYSRPDSNRQHQRKWGQETTIELYGVTWRMQVWPRSELLAGARSALPQLTLGMGLLMAILLALAVNLAQTARLRARAVEAANQGLEREISGREQMEDLRETIKRCDADLVLIGTPVDLRRLIELDKPALRVTYKLQEIGEPTLKDVLGEKGLLETALV